MLYLEAVVNNLAGAECWFKLDAFKGFWMMPLAEDCREMFSFMTDRGVFTPKRSIQGALNSAAQFQERMAEVCTATTDCERLTAFSHGSPVDEPVYTGI